MNVLSRSLYIIIKIWCAIIESAFKFSASRSSLILKPCLTWFWPWDSVKTKIITFHKYLNFSFLCNDFPKKTYLSIEISCKMIKTPPHFILLFRPNTDQNNLTAIFENFKTQVSFWLIMSFGTKKCAHQTIW